jgi:hypothetical protein
MFLVISTRSTIIDKSLLFSTMQNISQSLAPIIGVGPLMYAFGQTPAELMDNLLDG